VRLRDILLSAALLTMLALALGIAGYREPQSVTGPASVSDGDSLRVAGRAIRLDGVDAPELRQTCERQGSWPCGEAARDALRRLVDRQEVTCDLVGRDRYGRSLGRCRTEKRADLGADLVRGGHAVGYRRYEAEEADARERKRGLWAGTFTRPSDWRREQAAQPRDVR
jgi:endonuclease YncB( thermonuclease family)